MAGATAAAGRGRVRGTVLSQGSAAITSSDSADVSTPPPWGRRERRLYQRLHSVIYMLEERGYQIRLLHLTSSNESDATKITYHVQQLVQRIERQLGYEGMIRFTVRTREGEGVEEARRGVLHMVIAWKGPRTFWVPQPWISSQWQELHGAKVAWITSYGGGDRNRKRVSRYFVSQYFAGQSALVRYSWSWKRLGAKGMAKLWSNVWWAGFVAQQPFRDTIVQWQSILRGEVVTIGHQAFALSPPT